MATDSVSYAGPFLSTSATDLLSPAPALHAWLPDKQGASRPATGLVLREMNGQDLENGFLDTLADLAEVQLTLEQAREVLRQRLRRDVRTYVACQDGRVVGTASLLVEQKFIHGGGRCGHIEDVVVQRTWQGCGVAQALVRYAVQEARRLGCYKVILNCFEALVPFYTRCGFRTHDTGMRLNLPVTPPSSESM
ncbi:MAG TPA: GNAT family N-acetyltransferase [Gemmataceae bacterium]|nr:GNAT family N-acetyltransferase [Gemmataceae bacterium]